MPEYIRHQAVNDTLASLDAAISTPNSRTRGFQSMIDQDGRDADVTTLMYQDVTRPLHFGGMDTVFDQTTAAILNQDDPGAKTTQVLFSDFVNIFVSHQSDAQIWDEIAGYEKACSDQVEILERIIRKAPKDHANFIRTKDMVKRMQQERDTWRLLGSLCNERLSEGMDTEEIPQEISRNKTDFQIISDSYETSSKLRTAQIVIDWLERKTQDSYLQPQEYISNTNLGWENTYRSLKNSQQKLVDTTSLGKRKIVTSLDPDAPIREGTPIHDLDQEEDLRLVKLMFGAVRSGRLSAAQDLSAKAGHPWRAAILEGWKLHHDPNIQECGSRNPVSGNPYRDIWKFSAWAAASDPTLPAYERAIYGSLCGHLPSVLEVCRTWDDQLWAYYRTLVDQYVEESLRGNAIHLRTLENLPEEYPVNKLSVDQIFDAIASRLGSKSREDKYNVIQEYLIRDNMEGMIAEICLWIYKGEMVPHLLRCVSHMLLVLKRCGKIPFSQTEQLVEVLHECVKESTERGDSDQVAWYCSVLPEKLQVQCFASFLINIHDEYHRTQALNLSKLVGLHTEAITATVVATARLTPSGETSELNTDITPEDKVKINAIDWLLFDDKQRPEAVRQANCLMRSFLLSRKVSSAKLLFSKIPEDSLELIMKLGHQISEDLPVYLENRTREYLCYKIFLSAQEAFADWFDHYHQNKPQSLKKPKADMKFAEKLAHDHAMQRYETEVQKWRQTSEHLSKKAVERLYNIVLFPEGGWLVDVTFPDTAETSSSDPDLELGPESRDLLQHLDPEVASREHCRFRQMTTLRSIYVPQVFSLLQNVLHSTEKFKEAIRLADLVASEQHKLYKCFSPGEMQRFLLKLQETSKVLLDKNFDALGYPTF